MRGLSGSGTQAGSKGRHSTRLILGVFVFLLSATALSGCYYYASHEGTDPLAPNQYALVEEANGTYQRSQDHAYEGSSSAKAHFNGGTQQDSYARGTFNVNVGNGFEGYYGAAFYFPTGTFSGSTPTQTGDIDIVRWDNKRTYGDADFDYGGLRIYGSDNRARLVRQHASDPAEVIGDPITFKEGCWNLVWIHQRASSNNTVGTNEPQAINEVFVNGTKVLDSSSRNNFSRGIDSVRFGLVNIREDQQAGPLDMYVDNAIAADPDTSTHPQSAATPHSKVCEPPIGDRRPYRFEKQNLNDRMNLSVNLANGNLLLAANDLKIAGTGHDLQIDRYYNSESERISDHVGRSWSMTSTSDIRLRYTTDDGAILDGPSGYSATFKPKSGGGFETPAGFNADLTKASDGTAALKIHPAETKLNFHSNGRLSSIEDKNDNRITFAYDATGRVASVRDTQDQDSGDPATATFSYVAGQLRTITDRSSRTWQYTYNGNKLATYTDPENGITRYTYTGDKLTQVEDPLGGITQITYEPRHFRRVKTITRIDPAGPDPVTTFDYSSGSPCDQGRRMTVVTNPNGNATKYCIESGSEVREVFDGEGQKRSIAYTSNYEVQTYTTNANQTTGLNSTFSYDGSKLSGITTKTGPTSSISSTATYQAPSGGCARSTAAAFQPARVTDPQGQQTDFCYDDKGNLTSTTDGTGHVDLERGASGKGQITKLTDGRNNSTTYEYDVDGNLKRIVPPTSASAPTPPKPTNVTYDNLRRIKTVTDGKGQTRTLSYDKLDRIKSVAFGDGSSTTNTWDSNGNLRQRDDFAGGVTSSTVYAYDALNRLKREDFPDGAWNSYQYDLVGNLASLADTSGSVVYAYDRANRLKTVREPGGDCATTPGVGCTRLVYTDNEPDDGAGSSRVTTTLPNGVVIRRTSDAAGRMKRVSARDSSGQLLKSFDYTYTEAGVETMLVQQATNNANETTSYDYGARNRLTDVQVRDSSQALLEHYEYQYDAMANITERRINGNPTSYSFNVANQLCWRFSGATSNGCSNPPAGSVGYQWDDNGNELGNDAGLILGYNAKDQTVRHKDEDATSPVDVTFLGYNQLERIRAGAVTFQNNVLGIGRRTDTTGQAVYFTRTEDGRLIGARPSGSGKYYYVTDGFGSVVALTNASGQIVRHYKYDPYGNLTLNSPSSGAPIDFFRFRGVYNGSAGHYQFGHRLFDPRTGRWTQQDPIDTGGSLKEGNRYSYVGGDPVNRVDSIGTGIGSVVSGVSDAVGDLGDDIDAGIDRFGNLTFDEGVIAASTSIFGGAVCDAALPLAATGPWGVVGAASVCAAGAAGTIYTTWQAGETPGNDLM